MMASQPMKIQPQTSYIRKLPWSITITPSPQPPPLSPPLSSLSTQRRMGRPGNWCNNCTSCKTRRTDGGTSLSHPCVNPPHKQVTPLRPFPRLLLLLPSLSPPPIFIPFGLHHRRGSLGPALARP